jgi:ABC-type spermidine/putrescine transport system permease subunit II
VEAILEVNAGKHEIRGMEIVEAPPYRLTCAMSRQSRNVLTCAISAPASGRYNWKSFMPVDRYSLLALGPEIAAIATAAALLLGVSLAWIVENRQFRGKRTFSACATAATALPAPLLCYYLLAQWGHAWPLTRLGLAAAGVVSTLPFLLRRLRSSFASLDPSYHQAARSLGASEWRVFALVDLPLVWRSIPGAAALAFVRVLLELMAAWWIAEPRV